MRSSVNDMVNNHYTIGYIGSPPVDGNINLFMHVLVDLYMSLMTYTCP